MGTENMEILKVVIADDEVRICQLIQALIDWDSMGMKVVGIAHNGEEACEMVRQTQPDILITDIRMPGCSGLELVKRVKELDSALEVIIISGYAHFEYAQQAISYGVGHYLLKPVNKGELTATLQKLQKKIGERKESELNHQELVNKAKRDDDHLRANLIDRLLDQPDMPVSQDTLTSIYHLKARQGVYQSQSRAEGEKYHVFLADARAEFPFRHRARFRVVHQTDRYPQSFTQIGANGHAVPAGQIGRRQDKPLFAVQRAAAGYARRRNILFRKFQKRELALVYFAKAVQNALPRAFRTNLAARQKINLSLRDLRDQNGAFRSADVKPYYVHNYLRYHYQYSISTPSGTLHVRRISPETISQRT